MDNLTHTLVGAALAEAGLKRRTALGSATLMIGANFPDIDVLAVPLGYGIEWRRGITHGILAHFVLPFVLAGIMWLVDRQVRRRRDPSVQPADFRQLTILSAIAILTHPVLDFMNTYGMRWLMPFVDRWFYADGLFIVDIWVFGALLLGVIWSRRDRVTRPAQIALGAVAAYTIIMLGITGAGRSRVAQKHPGARFMVAPEALAPWRRTVIVDKGGGYWWGDWSLVGGLGPGYEFEKGEQDPAVALAKRDPAVNRFLKWARFPYYRVSRQGATTVVSVLDARYAGAEWASVVVALP